jgi:hypothetical protein
LRLFGNIFAGQEERGEIRFNFFGGPHREGASCSGLCIDQGKPSILSNELNRCNKLFPPGYFGKLFVLEKAEADGKSQKCQGRRG